MRLLKDNKILREYIIPIILFPFSCLIIRYIASLLFQMGIFYGTFFRSLLEMVLHNI